MAERIVINTGPLITLARMEALDVPGQLAYEVICPEEVRARAGSRCGGRTSYREPILEALGE